MNTYLHEEIIGRLYTAILFFGTVVKIRTNFQQEMENPLVVRIPYLELINQDKVYETQYLQLHTVSVTYENGM